MRISRILPKSKPFFITTPIFYVNASPHIGHLYSMVLADTIKRWKDLIYPDRGAYLLTGTDEHGQKVLQAAVKAGYSNPKEFVDKISGKFKLLADKANISYSRFIRTTDADHKLAAQGLWETLKSKNFIRKDMHKGWYCVSDEMFVPDYQLVRDQNGTFLSRISGKPVKWTEEENYYFEISKLVSEPLRLFNGNEKLIVPKSKYQQSLNEFIHGTEDFSISRPKSRFSWGIPVPGDDNQLIYVWMDALVNYLTFAGYPDKLKDIWPPDVQVIGKDIQRFHTIYFLGFLLAADIETPKQFLVHSHWLMNDEKMSKSTGNVADPFELIDKYGADSVRFFLQFDGNIDHDTPYDTELLISRHNVELMNKFGNLIMRVCGRGFDIGRAVRNETAESSSSLSDRVDNLSGEIDRLIASFDISGALRHIWTLIGDTNTYLQENEPWSLSGNDQDIVIRNASEVARVCSILLSAFIPDISDKCLTRLGVSPDKRGIEYAKYGADKTYGEGVNYKGPPLIERLKTGGEMTEKSEKAIES